jgi:hypothetical protein
MFIARSVESGLGMALNSGSVQPWCVDTTGLMKRPSDMPDAVLALKCGRFTVVDAEDAPLLKAHNWRSRVDPKSGTVYVEAQIKRGGKRPRVHLHRLVAGTLPGEHTDHIDGDGLNNRRANLRRCQPMENGRNRRPNRNSPSPYKGVYLIAVSGKWRARIRVNYRQIHLGCHSTPEDAAAAYNEAAIKHFGEFANLNVLP